MRMCSERIRQCVRSMRSDSHLLRVFRRNRRGNIGMIFVLMSSVLFLFVGGALDYSRWNAVRTDMIESMDAASLAVAQLKADNDTLSSAQLEAFGDEFFLENFNYEDNLLPGWDVVFNVQSSGNIRTCMTGQIKTHLLGIAHIQKLNMDKCVEITPEGAGRIELAMVLDVTGSMGGQKILDLKSAVGELLTVLYKGDTETTSDNVRIGVVPFNQHVNPGGSTGWSDSWGDQDAQSYYHGKRFIHVDETGAVDATTKVNHYRLYDIFANTWRDWEGCVEARPYPLDEMDTEPGVTLTSVDITGALLAPTYADEPDTDVRDAFTYAPSFPHGMTAGMLASSDNSRWVPVFLGDTVDCNSYKECKYNNNKRYDDGYVNGEYWDGEWYTDPDDDNYLGIYESSYSYSGNQNYFVSDREITRIDWNAIGFERYLKPMKYFRDVASGATSDVAFREWMDFNKIIDEDQEYIFRMGYVGWWDPAANTYKYKYEYNQNSGNTNPSDCPPAILPLTDNRTAIENYVAALSANGGTNVPNGAVWGWRVVSADAPFTEAIGPGEIGVNNTTESDWQKAVLIMTDGNNDFADRSTHWGSWPSAYGFESEERMGDGVDEADDSTDNDMEGRADQKLLRICHRMKQDDVLVYAVVFDVSVGSDIERAMKSCASSDTSPFFHNASTGADLEDAFGLIASDLVKLHVSE